jgi:hypothetical protein
VVHDADLAGAELALDLAQVGGGGRVVAGLDDREAGRGAGAGSEAPDAPPDVVPDGVRDRPPGQEPGGQSKTPT